MRDARPAKTSHTRFERRLGKGKEGARLAMVWVLTMGGAEDGKNWRIERGVSRMGWEDRT